MDADDAEFAATQKIGNKIHALAQAEAVFDSLVEPPPHVRCQLESFTDGRLDVAD